MCMCRNCVTCYHLELNKNMKQWNLLFQIDCDMRAFIYDILSKYLIYVSSSFQLHLLLCLCVAFCSKWYHFMLDVYCSRIVSSEHETIMQVKDVSLRWYLLLFVWRVRVIRCSRFDVFVRPGDISHLWWKDIYVLIC